MSTFTGTKAKLWEYDVRGASPVAEISFASVGGMSHSVPEHSNPKYTFLEVNFLKLMGFLSKLG